MMRFLFFIWAIMILGMHSAAVARIGSVPHSKVTKGSGLITSRTAYTQDNERKSLDKLWRSRIVTDYGINDWYATGFIVEGRNMQDESPELTRAMWENRVELTTTAEEGFYSGFRLRYEHFFNDIANDTVHIRLIAGKEIRQWDIRLNQIIAMEVGSTRNAGAIWDTRTHIAYKYHPSHAVGVESFHVLGNLSARLPYASQSHFIGPTFFGALHDELRYETGYMVGISRAAPDHSFYLGIIKDF